jgi:T5SS/PEP-CTERM-associated repeat protein
LTTYYFLGGDSFDDPNNWYNVTAGKPDDGVPGSKDTIAGSTAEIPAAGETVANAEGAAGNPANPVEISGNLTITDEGSDLWLLFGGGFSIGSIVGGYIVMSNNTTVTAGSVDLSQPNNTGLSLDGTSSLTVTGPVVASGDDIDTSGAFDVHDYVHITNATLESDGGATTIRRSLTLDSGSYLDLYQGSASVGSLNVDGSTVQVGSSFGATLKVRGDATVSNGVMTVTDAASQVDVGGDETLGEEGSGTLTMTGGTMSVVGNMTLGEEAGSSGKLVLSDSAVVGVDGDMTIGAAADGTVTLGSTAASSAVLGWGNLLTVGAGEGAEGTLTINAGDKVIALAEDGTGELAIGADAGSSGTVSLAGADASLTGTALFVGGTASQQGGDGSLSISAGGSTTFDDATIWSTGKVTDAGELSISGTLSGPGSVQISDAGQFTLGGSDSSVGIDFVSGGSNERLDVSAAHLPSVEIKGFGAHDTIDVSGLSHGDRSASATRAPSPPCASLTPARPSEACALR